MGRRVEGASGVNHGKGGPHLYPQGELVWVGPQYGPEGLGRRVSGPGMQPGHGLAEGLRDVRVGWTGALARGWSQGVAPTAGAPCWGLNEELGQGLGRAGAEFSGSGLKSEPGADSGPQPRAGSEAPAGAGRSAWGQGRLSVCWEPARRTCHPGPVGSKH